MAPYHPEKLQKNELMIAEHFDDTNNLKLFIPFFSNVMIVLIR